MLSGAFPAPTRLTGTAEGLSAAALFYVEQQLAGNSKRIPENLLDDAVLRVEAVVSASSSGKDYQNRMVPVLEDLRKSCANVAVVRLPPPLLPRHLLTLLTRRFYPLALLFHSMTRIREFAQVVRLLSPADRIGFPRILSCYSSRVQPEVVDEPSEDLHAIIPDPPEFNVVNNDDAMLAEGTKELSIVNDSEMCSEW